MNKTANTMDPDVLLERAEALIPTLAERAKQTDTLRRLPDETMADLEKAGLHRLGQPARFGGAELRLDQMAKIVGTLARGCASTAWVAGIYYDHSFMLNRMGPQAVEDVWGGDPDAKISAGVTPSGTVERIEGGWRIAGTWGYASGCDFADWFLLGALLPDETGAKTHRLCLVPRSEVAIDDNWRVMGQAGTGSKNVVVAGATIPPHRTLGVDALNDNAPDAAVAYRPPHRGVVPFHFCATILGCADSLRELVVDDMTRRQSRGQRVAEYTTVQMRIAEASAILDCVRLLIARDMQEAVEAAETGRLLTIADRARYRRDQAYACRLCRQAAELLFDVTGAAGNFSDSVAQLKFRDIRAATSHLGLSWDVAAPPYGRVAMGLPPETFLI